MSVKFPLGILITVSFLFSCSSKHEKENNRGSVEKRSILAEVKSPLDDFIELEQKLRKDSLNIELRTLLASNYYVSKELDKAAYHFLIIYELDHKNLAALSNLGNIYYDSQEDDKAIEFYEKSLEIDSKNVNLRCDLAVCYSRINRLKKAIQILKENIKIDERHEKSHYNLSVLQKLEGNFEESDQEMKIYNTLISSSK